MSTRQMLHIPVAGTPGLVDAGDLDQMRRAIGCQWIDIVGIGDGWSMVVDDEGILSGRDKNERASILYGTPLHGHPIVGDVLLGREGVAGIGERDLLDTAEADALALLTERGAA